MAASKAFVNRVWQHFLQNKGHDANCFSQMKVVSATPGLFRGSLVVDSTQLNRLKTLHGGLIASLVDTSGSLALATKGFWFTGVSTDINVTFVRAAQEGDELLIESKLVSLGKTLAFTRTEISSSKTGRMLAYGSHTKYIANAFVSKENETFDEAGEVLVGSGEKVR